MNRVIKLSTGISSAKGAKKAAVKKKPAVSELLVQFSHPEDPSPEQTERVRELLKKFTKRARVVAELPGALKVAVVPANEAQFRQEVDALPDWNIASEGVASMPSKPLPDDDESAS